MPNAEDPDLLAVIEGWHDFASRYPHLVGTLYVDYLTKADRSGDRLLSGGQGPAIPPAFRDDPIQTAKEQYAAKEAKATVRQAGILAELKELAVRRVVIDLTAPPAQRIRLTRKRITDKFPRVNFHAEVRGLSEDDRALAQQTGELADWLKGMSFASFADVANSVANLTARLASTSTAMLENRAKFNAKPSRSAREAESKLRPKVQKCLDQLAQLAQAQTQEAPGKPLQEAWRKTATRVEQARLAVAERTMPVQASPYETEEYERLEAMSREELNRLAIRGRTEYAPHDPNRRERLLLLAGGWVVRWTEDQDGATEPDIRVFNSIHFPYNSWNDCITALSQQTQPEGPADLRRLVKPPQQDDDTVHLADMKPTQIREFAWRFYRAAAIELDQRLHTVPERMREPAIATLRNLSYDTTRRERYTAGRYRDVVGHAVRAYLACRFPGSWETAVDEMNKAANVRRRAGEYDDGAAVQSLQEWLAAAELEYVTEVAGRPPEDNITAIWRNAISQAQKATAPVSRPAPVVKLARRKTARPQDLTFPLAL